MKAKKISNEQNSLPATKLYSLFIGGLKSTTNRKVLFNHFKFYGEIVNVKLKYDKVTKRNKGFAFIDFKCKEGVDLVLQNQQTIEGRTVECKRGGLDNESRIQANKIDKYNSSLCKIFIHGLKSYQTADDLRAYFSKYGEITNAYLIYHPETKESKGFGYVHFASKDSVENAFYDVVVEGADEFKFERFKFNQEQTLENEPEAKSKEVSYNGSLNNENQADFNLQKNSNLLASKEQDFLLIPNEKNDKKRFKPNKNKQEKPRPDCQVFSNKSQHGDHMISAGIPNMRQNTITNSQNIPYNSKKIQMSKTYNSESQKNPNFNYQIFMDHVQNYEHLKKEYDFLQAEAQKPKENLNFWRNNQETKDKEFYEYMMKKQMAKNFENSYNEFEMHKQMYMMYLKQKMSHEKEFLQDMEKVTDTRCDENTYEQNCYNNMHKPEQNWSLEHQKNNSQNSMDPTNDTAQNYESRVKDPCNKSNYYIEKKNAKDVVYYNQNYLDQTQKQNLSSSYQQNESNNYQQNESNNYQQNESNNYQQNENNNYQQSDSYYNGDYLQNNYCENLNYEDQDMQQNFYQNYQPMQNYNQNDRLNYNENFYGDSMQPNQDANFDQEANCNLYNDQAYYPTTDNYGYNFQNENNGMYQKELYEEERSVCESELLGATGSQMREYFNKELYKLAQECPNKLRKDSGSPMENRSSELFDKKSEKPNFQKYEDNNEHCSNLKTTCGNA